MLQEADKWTPADLARLRQNLQDGFSDGELQTLCFDLGIAYENLPGQSKADKAREIIAYLSRHSRIEELISAGAQLRPKLVWQETEPVAAFHAAFSEAARDRQARSLEFADRESELKRLDVERLRASQSPFTLISAPTGYGKTYLLRQLLFQLDADPALRQSWTARYLDFSQVAGDPIAFMARAIVPNPEVLEGDPAGWLGLASAAIIQKHGAPLGNGRGGRRAVLLVLDGVERLDETARDWLYRLLSEVRRRTRSGQTEIVPVRVLVAGRDVEAFWEGYERVDRPPAPQRIRLSPFDDNPIQDMVWKQARAAEVTLDDQTVVQIATEIQFLSGGHPRVIRSLLDDLASQSFAVGPVHEYFAGQRDMLVRRHLASVAAGLLDPIGPRLARAMRTLSLFRRMNANTVQTLVEAKALALPPGVDEVQLLGELQRVHLLDKPIIQEPFYRDHLMQHILALDLACSSRAEYRRLNRLALRLYAGWIHNLGEGLPDTPLKATQRLLSVVEWLLHALQEEELDEAGLRAELGSHAGALQNPGDDALPVAGLITDEIKKDSEVCYLIRHRLGEDGVTRVCDWLQPAPHA